MAEDKGGSTTVIPAEVKEQVGKLTVDQFKTEWPSVYEAIGKASVPKPPETYEGLKVPEKSVLPETVLTRTTALGRELGLTDAKHAQRLIDFTNTEAQQVLDAMLASYKPGGAKYQEQLKQWEDAALKAPDLGAGNSGTLQAKVARATAFTNKHFPEGLRTLLTESGIGSHPEFFRAMLKLADLSKEDIPESGDSGKGEKKSHAERIYGK